MSFSTAQISNELRLCESQLSTFTTKGTKSSATCSRRHLLQITKLCNKLRRDILVKSKESKKESKAQETPPPTPPNTPELEEKTPVEPVVASDKLEKIKLKRARRKKK